MALTEFYAQTSGSNLNAGSTTADATSFTYASGTWVQSTRVFTVASGNPSSDGVAVGDFASVYPDGSAVAVFIGRVTARDTTTITISSTAKSGTAPADGTGTRTLKIGGAWKGPNAAVGFPFGFITGTLTNAAGDIPRVNFKNNAIYSVTAQITHNTTGPIQFQGYSSTVGDGGRATISGGTSGASFILMSAGSDCNDYVDLIFKNNGATGSQRLVQNLGSHVLWHRCVFTGSTSLGMYASGSNQKFVECEVYSNASNAFFASGVSTHLIRTISHDNSGDGFVIEFNTMCIDCIADSNTGIGFNVTSNIGSILGNCDAYNNGSDGIRLVANDVFAAVIENCNLVKNGGWGINGSGAGARRGVVTNCGFGSGDKVNTSGTTTGLSGIVESGSITYAANVTPWVDPANGDFRINLAAAKGTGRGTFTQTPVSGYTGGTVGYPDVGASQHQETAGTSGGFIIGG